MAIRIATEYVNAEAPSGDYPGGSFKNESAPDLNDGTPADKVWADDWTGFFQRLMVESGLTYSDVADTVLASQYFDSLLAVVQKNDNLLRNGCCRVAQRGAGPFTGASDIQNDDDTYLLDQTILLSDGNDIVDVSQVTADVPDGSYAAIELDVETINKKFGVLKIIEASEAAKIIGGNASVSFDARVTDITKLDNIKCMVVSWDGSADAVTSDIIQTWNAEDTTPTLVANWTIENSPADLGVTASWVKYKIEGIAIDTASVKNVGVFIWSDGFCDTLGTILKVTNIKLEPGLIVTPLQALNIGLERLACKRHFERITALDNSNARIGAGLIRATTSASIILEYIEKRIVPHTISESDGTHFNVMHGITSTVCTGVNAGQLGKISANFSGTVVGGLTVGEGTMIRFNTAAGYIDISSEL